MSLLVWFVIWNLVVANFATVITKLTLHVQVVADDSGEPVGGARLFRLPRVGLPWDLIGTTGGDGSCGIAMTFPVAQYWMWPGIGTILFGRTTVEVQASGFQPATVVLSEALPQLASGTSEAPLLVRLCR